MRIAPYIGHNAPYGPHISLIGAIYATLGVKYDNLNFFNPKFDKIEFFMLQ